MVTKQKAILGVTAAAVLGISSAVVSHSGEGEKLVDATKIDSAGNLLYTDLLTEEVVKDGMVKTEVTIDKKYIPGVPEFSGAAYGCFSIEEMTLSPIKDSDLAQFVLIAQNKCPKRRLTAYLPLKLAPSE